MSTNVFASKRSIHVGSRFHRYFKTGTLLFLSESRDRGGSSARERANEEHPGGPRWPQLGATAFLTRKENSSTRTDIRINSCKTHKDWLAGVGRLTLAVSSPTQQGRCSTLEDIRHAGTANSLINFVELGRRSHPAAANYQKSCKTRIASFFLSLPEHQLPG